MKNKTYEIKRIRTVCQWLHRKMKPTRDEIAFMIRYTARVPVGRKFNVELTVFHQGFFINHDGHSLQEADWIRLMLAKALISLVKQERLYPFSGVRHAWNENWPLSRSNSSSSKKPRAKSRR